MAKRKGLECEVIESAKRGCDFTQSLSVMAEDKGMRTARYVVILLGMISRWRDIRRNVRRHRFRPLLGKEMGNFKNYMFEPGLLPVLPLGGGLQEEGKRGLLFDDTTKNKRYVIKAQI